MTFPSDRLESYVLVEVGPQVTAQTRPFHNVPTIGQRQSRFSAGHGRYALCVRLPGTFGD